MTSSLISNLDGAVNCGHKHIWSYWISRRPLLMSGIFPVSIDLWKISCRMSANSLCYVWRTMGLNLSGPAALCGLKPLSSWSMPSAAMLISGIFGWGLGWNEFYYPSLREQCNLSPVWSAWAESRAFWFWPRGFPYILVRNLRSAGPRPAFIEFITFPH